MTGRKIIPLGLLLMAGLIALLALLSKPLDSVGTEPLLLLYCAAGIMAPVEEPLSAVDAVFTLSEGKIFKEDA